MKGLNSVYLAWQAPDTKTWYVVGLLTEHEDYYTFSYTKGALKSEKFIPFSGMKDLDKMYVSDELFPLFKNRLLSEKRPEYPRFIEWLDLGSDEVSPIEVLGRSGGLRGTDKLQMFNRVEIENDGYFEHVFFAHVLGYLSQSAKDRVSGLQKNEKLLLCLDCQNSYDGNAVIIRAENPAEILGYCPSYLAKDISSFLKKNRVNLNISVESFSENAPDHYKLLCKLSGKIDSNLINEFMSKDEFSLIAQVKSEYGKVS